MTDGLTEALGGARVICRSEGFTLIVRVSGDEAEKLAGKLAEKLRGKCWTVR